MPPRQVKPRPVETASANTPECPVQESKGTSGVFGSLYTAIGREESNLPDPLSEDGQKQREKLSEAIPQEARSAVLDNCGTFQTFSSHKSVRQASLLHTFFDSSQCPIQNDGFTECLEEDKLSQLDKAWFDHVGKSAGKPSLWSAVGVKSNQTDIAGANNRDANNLLQESGTDFGESTGNNAVKSARRTASQILALLGRTKGSAVAGQNASRLENTKGLAVFQNENSAVSSRPEFPPHVSEAPTVCDSTRNNTSDEFVAPLTETNEVLGDNSGSCTDLPMPDNVHFGVSVSHSPRQDAANQDGNQDDILAQETNCAERGVHSSPGVEKCDAVTVDEIGEDSWNVSPVQDQDNQNRQGGSNLTDQPEEMSGTTACFDLSFSPLSNVSLTDDEDPTKVTQSQSQSTKLSETSQNDLLVTQPSQRAGAVRDPKCSDSPPSTDFQSFQTIESLKEVCSVGEADVGDSSVQNNGENSNNNCEGQESKAAVKQNIDSDGCCVNDLVEQKEECSDSDKMNMSNQEEIYEHVKELVIQSVDAITGQKTCETVCPTSVEGNNCEELSPDIRDEAGIRAEDVNCAPEYAPNTCQENEKSDVTAAAKTESRSANGESQSANCGQFMENSSQFTDGSDGITDSQLLSCLAMEESKLAQGEMNSSVAEGSEAHDPGGAEPDTILPNPGTGMESCDGGANNGLDDLKFSPDDHPLHFASPDVPNDR